MLTRLERTSFQISNFQSFLNISKKCKKLKEKRKPIQRSSTMKCSMIMPLALIDLILVTRFPKNSKLSTSFLMSKNLSSSRCFSLNLFRKPSKCQKRRFISIQKEQTKVRASQKMLRFFSRTFWYREPKWLHRNLIKLTQKLSFSKIRKKYNKYYNLLFY